MKSITRRILIQLGLSPKYKGYTALVEAVNLYIEFPNTKITAIYELAGRKLYSSYSKVERNIRKAITVILDRNDEDLLYKIFGFNVLSSGTIINGDFISCLAAYVQEVNEHE